MVQGDILFHKRCIYHLGFKYEDKLWFKIQIHAQNNGKMVLLLDLV